MNIKNLINKLLGNINIPEKLIHSDDPLLLHISDTPVFTYRPIKKLIREIKPDYIIHTGDISDDLKVEIYPNLESDSIKKALSFIEFLAKQNCKIYISTGNHDSLELLSLCKNKKNISITDSKEYIEVNGRTIAFSHYSNLLKKKPGDINLYGHDLSIPSQSIDGNLFLNGIEYINIINLRTFKIYRFKYPLGTENSRLRKFKPGI